MVSLEKRQVNKKESDFLMSIRFAKIEDLKIISFYDKHIKINELENLIELGRVLILEENNTFCGWLRYSLFWDNTPFMNMLYFLESKRGKGYGKKLVEFWETEMRTLDYEVVMTSTASNEYSQHFYLKLGYKTVGGFMPEGEPYEIILLKHL